MLTFDYFSTGFENAEVAVEFHGTIIYCKSPFSTLILSPKEFCPTTPSELTILPPSLFFPPYLFF